MKYFKQLLLLLFLHSYFSHSQSLNEKIIQIKNNLSNPNTTDSLKIKLYSDLCWYYGSLNKDSASYYGNLALSLSQKTNNLKGQAQAYNDLGILQYKTSNFNKAVSYYKKSLVIRNKIRDTLGIASLYNKLGIAYQRIFKMDSALQYNTKALEIYEYKNIIKYSAIVRNNIANVYSGLKLHKKALKEHLIIADIRKKINDDFGLVYSYTNIGNSYLFLKDTIKSINFYNLGISIAKKNNYKKELGTLYNNLGTIHKDLGQYKKAEILLTKALNIRENINSKYGIASVKLNLGELKLRLGKLSEARKKLSNGVKLFKEINANDKILNGYNFLLQYHAHKKHTDSVLIYQKLVNTMQDSILNSRITKEIAEVQEKYNTAKKEKEIALQKEEILENELKIKNRNLYATLLGGALLIVGILSIGYYHRSSFKRKQLEKEIELKDALSKIKTQNRLQEQRLRISRDLHDNIGSQLTFIISSIDNLKYISKDLNDVLKSKLTNISDFTSDTIHQLRDTIWAMNKNEISIDDFSTRLLSFIEKAKEAVPSITFKYKNNIPSHINFTSIEGMNLFRVTQEAINNAVKYSEGDLIELNATQKDNKLQLTIQDNGKGFDINNVTLGSGLSNMEKRMSSINGSVFITSENGKGTTITLQINNTTNDV
ncbi:hypothetical protein WH52_14070 [Tenacibaculum holothuriorum]|uniref:histidine kinase n=1 Tax=Tenacibaculum holothuriorum TaxID=1635173 RepID=A0A1Y2P8Z5_9FLAO|nr:sensor histidine kinase [Tenacibaculum holothuriorum]OSY86906.1 hypothetical protein WH52_14070 [Tenacibaculum holothuriorum]